MERPCVKLLRLGRKSYIDALNIQRETANKIKSQSKSKSKPEHTLILVEHNAVYTTGIRTKNYTLEDQARLEKLGATFFRCDRGGLITFHGPGQLVAYPILHLHSFSRANTVRSYVCSLEESIIKTCRKLGVETEQTENPGVWVKGKDLKIAAIGIHCSRFDRSIFFFNNAMQRSKIKDVKEIYYPPRYVTTHGIALNCNTELTWFEQIVSCGLEGKGVTSLSRELSRPIPIDKVEPIFLKAFEQTFDCDVES